jgi:hypothetical protein
MSRYDEMGIKSNSSRLKVWLYGFFNLLQPHVRLSSHTRMKLATQI